MIIVRNATCPKYNYSIGTHNGIFHPDEVVAIAILNIAYPRREICVIRTRDEDILNQTTFNIDIGGGEFDHHQPGFNKKRPTGELYASAGLVWKAYAKEAIKTIRMEDNLNFQKLSDEEIEQLINKIDKDIIIPVDQEDNGKDNSTNHFSFINSFLPDWFESPNYNSSFEKALQVATTILRQLIKERIVETISKNYLKDKLNNKNEELSKYGILEIPAQTFPWLDQVSKHNEIYHKEIKFVIFPYPGGGWAAQCVPPSLAEKFKQICPFPKEWAGLKDSALAKVSKIPDAYFCHNFRFFVRAESRNSIITMCKVALVS